MSNKAMTIENGISIIMPTFRRPQDLPRALDSLLAQKDVELPVEIIVADNDPDASAKAVIAKYSRSSAMPIKYVHCPNPGVSNARNAAIAVAKGRYFAWLDDDQEAAPNWLSELLKTANKYKAQLVFCPSPPVMEVSTSLDSEYEDFFARKAPKADGVIENFYGCGNSLLDLKSVTLPDPVFDPIANESGGEDDMLFSYLQRNGAVVAWTSETYVYEHVPAKRATLSYVRKRSFAWGQGPTEIANDAGKKLEVLKWMIIGAVQLCVYSVPMAVTSLLNKPSQIHWTSKTCQGAGKLFWYRGLRPKLYGQATVANKVEQPAHHAKMPVQN